MNSESMKMLRTEELFDLNYTAAAKLFAKFEFPWQILSSLKSFILSLGAQLPSDEYDHPAEDIWIARSAVIAASASLTGPLIIGPDTELRQGAFIRGGVLIGSGCVVGNSCELKNSVLFDTVQVPHFNYVGDSVLGHRSHLGAGAITSNIKSDRTDVTLKIGGETIMTGLRKFGAMIGDGVEVGCNSVLNPGTVIGKNTSIYPLSMVRGYVPAGSIYKKQGEIAEKR